MAGHAGAVQENVDPSAAEASRGQGLAKLFQDGQKIATARTGDLFQELEKRSLSLEEEEIIRKRVEHQQRMLQIYERQDNQRKVQELMDVCPDLAEDEAKKALEWCQGREDEAAGCLVSDPEFMRRVRAAVRGSREPRPVRLARSQPQQRGFGARPKLVDMSKFEGSVFCGSFRGRGAPPTATKGKKAPGASAKTPTAPRGLTEALENEEVDGYKALQVSPSTPQDPEEDRGTKPYILVRVLEDGKHVPVTSTGLKKLKDGVKAAMGDESETETEATISLLQEGHNEAGRGASPQTVSKPTAKQDGPSKAGKASLKEDPRGQVRRLLAMDEVMRGDTAEELDVRCPETAKQRCGPVKRKRNSHAAPPTPQPLEAEGLMKAATIAAKSMSNLVKHLLSMKKEMFTQVLLRLDMMCPDMAGERRSLMSKTTGGDGLEVPPEAKGDTPQKPRGHAKAEKGTDALLRSLRNTRSCTAAAEKESWGEVKFGDRGGCNAPRDVGKTTAEEPSKGKAGKGTVEREGPGALGERPGVSGDKPVRKKRQLSLSQALRLGKKQEAKTEQQAKATGGGDAPALPEISSPKLRSACAEGAKAENAGSPSKTRADEGGNPRCQERRKNVSEVGRLAEKVQTKQSEGLSAADTHDSGSDFMGGDENNMASANPCGTSRPHRPLKTPKKGSAAAEGDHGAAGIEAKAAGDSISEAPTADGGQADAGREPTAARAVTKMTNSGRIGRVRHKAHKIVDLIKLGEINDKPDWYNRGYIFPMGFNTQTLFRSSVDVDQLCIHDCSIIGKGGQFWPKPTFKVVAMDRPDEPLIAQSCTGCWTQVLKRINAEIEALRKNGDPRPAPPKTAIAGPEYFGLCNPDIKEQIEALDSEHRCIAYWEGRAEIELMKAGEMARKPPRVEGRSAPKKPPSSISTKKHSSKRTRGRSSDSDDNTEDDETDYTTNRWSSVDRSSRYKKRCGDAHTEDDDNPLPGFIDPITLQPVVAPAISPYGHVMGSATWKAVLAEQGKCPFTQQPLKWTQMKVLNKNNIDTYIDLIKK